VDNLFVFFFGGVYTLIMIEHVKIFFQNGEPFPKGELQVGENGVQKMFFDKQDLSSLVVLTEDGIVSYHGFLYVCLKAYKEKEVE